jgi:hypothetical protein
LLRRRKALQSERKKNANKNLSVIAQRVFAVQHVQNANIAALKWILPQGCFVARNAMVIGLWKIIPALHLLLRRREDYRKLKNK